MVIGEGYYGQQGIRHTGDSRPTLEEQLANRKENPVSGKLSRFFNVAKETLTNKESRDKLVEAGGTVALGVGTGIATRQALGYTAVGSQFAGGLAAGAAKGAVETYRATTTESGEYLRQKTADSNDNTLAARGGKIARDWSEADTAAGKTWAVMKNVGYEAISWKSAQAAVDQVVIGPDRIAEKLHKNLLNRCKRRGLRMDEEVHRGIIKMNIRGGQGQKKLFEFLGSLSQEELNVVINDISTGSTEGKHEVLKQIQELKAVVGTGEHQNLIGRLENAARGDMNKEDIATLKAKTATMANRKKWGVVVGEAAETFVKGFTYAGLTSAIADSMFPKDTAQDLQVVGMQSEGSNIEADSPEGGSGGGGASSESSGGGGSSDSSGGSSEGGSGGGGSSSESSEGGGSSDSSGGSPEGSSDGGRVLTNNETPSEIEDNPDGSIVGGDTVISEDQVIRTENVGGEGGPTFEQMHNQRPIDVTQEVQKVSPGDVLQEAKAGDTVEGLTGEGDLFQIHSKEGDVGSTRIEQYLSACKQAASFSGDQEAMNQFTGLVDSIANDPANPDNIGKMESFLHEHAKGARFVITCDDNGQTMVLAEFAQQQQGAPIPINEDLADRINGIHDEMRAIDNGTLDPNLDAPDTGSSDSSVVSSATEANLDLTNSWAADRLDNLERLPDAFKNNPAALAQFQDLSGTTEVGNETFGTKEVVLMQIAERAQQLVNSGMSADQATDVAVSQWANDPNGVAQATRDYLAGTGRGVNVPPQYTGVASEWFTGAGRETADFIDSNPPGGGGPGGGAPGPSGGGTPGGGGAQANVPLGFWGRAGAHADWILESNYANVAGIPTFGANGYTILAGSLAVGAGAAWTQTALIRRREDILHREGVERAERWTNLVRQREAPLARIETLEPQVENVRLQLAPITTELGTIGNDITQCGENIVRTEAVKSDAEALFTDFQTNVQQKVNNILPMFKIPANPTNISNEIDAIINTIEGDLNTKMSNLDSRLWDLIANNPASPFNSRRRELDSFIRDLVSIRSGLIQAKNHILITPPDNNNLRIAFVTIRNLTQSSLVSAERNIGGVVEDSITELTSLNDKKSDLESRRDQLTTQSTSLTAQRDSMQGEIDAQATELLRLEREIYQLENPGDRAWWDPFGWRVGPVGFNFRASRYYRDWDRRMADQGLRRQTVPPRPPRRHSAAS